jgi:hypothetical protein
MNRKPNEDGTVDSCGGRLVDSLGAALQVWSATLSLHRLHTRIGDSLIS